MMFGVCACGDGSILITGGITRQREFSTEATRLDLIDDDRMAWVQLPDLSEARIGHACCGNRRNAIIFGGEIDLDRYATIEILS